MAQSPESPIPRQEQSVFKGIFRNTVALALSRVLERATTVVLSLYVARKLGAPGLGVYSAAMVFYGLICLAAEMGAPNYLIREVSRERSRTADYVVHLSILTGVLCCVLGGAAALIVPHLGYSADLRKSIYVVLTAVVPGMLKVVQEAVFIAHEKARFVTYTTAAAAASYVVVTVWLLRQGHGVVAIVGAFAAIQFFVACWYFVLIERYVSPLRWRFDWSFARKLIREVKVFAGSSVLAALTGRPEMLILSVVTTDAQVGLYSAGLRVGEVWALIPDTYMANVYAVLSRAYHTGDQERFQLMVERSVKYLLILALPLAAGLVVAAAPIVRLLFGPGFEAAAPVLRIQACNIPVLFVYGVLWRVLAARDRQGLVLRVQVRMAVARLAATAFLTAWLSIYGAALSVVLTMLVHSVILNASVRLHGTRPRVLALGWRACVAAIGMALATSLWIGLFPLWGVVLFAAAIYIGFIITVKAITAEDLALLRSLRSA